MMGWLWSSESDFAIVMSGSVTTVATDELDTEWALAGKSPVQFSFATFASESVRRFAATFFSTPTIVSDRATPLLPPERLVVGEETSGAVTVLPLMVVAGPGAPATCRVAE